MISKPSRARPRPVIQFIGLWVLSSWGIASGAVTFVDVVPDIRTNILNVEFNVDIDGSGFRDVWFVQSSSTLKAFSTTDVRIQSVLSDIATYYPVPISAGTEIGPVAVPPGSWNYSGPPFNYSLSSVILIGSQLVVFGLFPGHDAYLGIEMTLADGIHYGYIQVEVPNLTTLAIIKSYAFETTPGVPIIAGSVPEPARSLLMICFLAAVLLRRRRAFGAG